MTKYVASPRRDDLIIVDYFGLIDPERRPYAKEELEPMVAEITKHVDGNILENLHRQIEEYGKEKTDR